MKKITLLGLLLTLSFSLKAQTVKAVFSPFQSILSEYLSEKELDDGGLVSAFRYQDATNDSRLVDLRSQQKKALKDINLDFLTDKNTATAFWINAYNFFMIDYILTHKEDGKIVSSVKDYGSFFNPYKVFSKKFITIAGKPYTLDEIEKDILLGDGFKEKGWFDTKVHFAVNCASVGCPPLRKNIYTSQNLQTLLKENTEKALRTPRHLSLKGDTLYLTQLFEWYEDDFKRESGTVIKFIQKYGPNDVIKKINEKTNIDYIKYDWDINKPENFNDI